MSNWKAGDKAVCVSRFEILPDDVSEGPKVGVTYLVSGVSMGHGLLGLHIAGISSGDNPFGWWAERFRKVIPACDRISQEQEGLIPHEGFFEGRPDL